MSPGFIVVFLTLCMALAMATLMSIHLLIQG